MAIIRCSECGKEISDKAGTCPHCGCPVDELSIHHTAPNSNTANRSSYGKSIKISLIILAVNGVIWLTLGAAVVISNSGKEKSRPAANTQNAGSNFSGENESYTAPQQYKPAGGTGEKQISAQNPATGTPFTTESSNTDPTITTGQKNALDQARQYLNYSSFSCQGLIEQLEFEGFSHEEAIYGADYCGADWNEQALKQAKAYLNSSSFSYQGLIEQLEFDHFTNEQAAYGANNCGADWNEQAARSARSYLNFSSFSRDGLIEQLEFEGFTYEQALYGVQSNGY